MTQTNEHIKRLVMEYLDILPDYDGAEWYASYKEMARGVFLTEIDDLPGIDGAGKYPTFFEWLDSRTDDPD